MKYLLDYKKTYKIFWSRTGKLRKMYKFREINVYDSGVKIIFDQKTYRSEIDEMTHEVWVPNDRIYCRSDLGIVTKVAILADLTEELAHCVGDSIEELESNQMAVAKEALASLEPAPDLPPVTPTSDLFFLRFSEEPEEDQERGYSFDFTGMQPEDFCYDADGCETEEPDYSQLTDDSDMIEVLDDGTVAVKFEGLCGHILEAKTLEDAIQEVQEEGEWSGAAWSDLPKTIWVGEETEDYVPEGTAFQGELIWKEEVKPIPPTPAPTATPTPTPTPSLFDYKKNNVLEVKIFKFGVKIYFGQDDFEWVGKDRIYCRSDLGIVTEGAISDTKYHYGIRADQMAFAEELLASLEPVPDLPPESPDPTPSPTPSLESTTETPLETVIEDIPTPTPTPSRRSKVMCFAWTLRKQGIPWGVAQSMAWAAEAKKAEAIAAAVTFSETLSWDVKKKIRFGAMAITYGRDFARKSLKKNLAADYLAGRTNVMPRPKARPLFV